MSINGRPAGAPTVLSDFQLSTVVPAGATSGPVSVTTPSGVITSAVRFTVVPPPTVTSFSPSVGLGGTPITVSGSGFTTATEVTVGGSVTAFTVLSDTSLRATVPTDATSGRVAVSNVAGTASSAGSFTVTAPPPAPTVTGFSPGNGPPGTVVTVTGTNLATTTGVYFGGAASLSVAASATSVTAVVPSGGFSGVVSVLAAGGGATSAAAFQVTAPVLPPLPPVVAALSPSAGPVGSTVLISGTGFDFTTGVSFNGMPATFQQVTGGLAAVVPAGATTGPVVVTSADAGPGTGSVVFTVQGAGSSGPSLTSFAPGSGPAGTTVVVTGVGLAGTSAVSVNGVPAASFSALSPTAVSFVVGKKSTSGPVRLTTPGGVLTSSTSFVVGKASAVPTVTAPAPLAGPAGTTVTVTGTALTGATAVTVGGTPVASFRVGSATSLTLVVAAGTASGPVAVTTPIGTAVSAVPFTVTELPTLTALSPASGGVGTTVVLTGTGLSGATAVSVNGTRARSFTVQSGTQISFVVGTGTKTGPVSVVTPRGTAVSTVPFTITGKTR